MTSKDSRIRDKAYRLWEEDGFPDGQEIEHWHRARELVELEDQQGNATLPPPVAADGETARDEAEPTLAVENQGEFPTLTDQGEAQQAPMRPKRSANNAETTVKTPAKTPAKTTAKKSAAKATAKATQSNDKAGKAPAKLGAAPPARVSNTPSGPAPRQASGKSGASDSGNKKKGKPK